MTTLDGPTLVLRTTDESDRSELERIRLTPDVRARWPAVDLNAEFDRDSADEDLHRFTIVRRSSDVIVGLVQFYEESDPEYRHASIDIYVDPAAHRQGVATEALQLLLRHLLDDRGHHRVTIDPAADNQPAIACYEAVGFRRVGVMRRYERQEDGTWADGLLMELLDSDYAPRDQTIPSPEERPE